MNKEKFYIAIIVFLTILAFYFAVKANRKIEIRFSKPVYPIGNFAVPEKLDIWQIK